MKQALNDLDRADRKILKLLQEDGSITNAELSERVNISPATCHRRTKRLFDEGYITGVRAIIEPRKVGLDTLVMVGIVLDRSTPESFSEFEKAAVGLKGVLQCDLVAGEFDYLLRIRVKDIDGFNNFHSKKLITLPGVRQARSFFVLKEVKTAAPLEF